MRRKTTTLPHQHLQPTRRNSSHSFRIKLLCLSHQSLASNPFNTMATLTRLPLETYLLAGQAAPLEFANLPARENRVSAEMCHICARRSRSPALVSTKNARPASLPASGRRNSGKTAYLGMLMDMLMRQAASLRTTLLGPDSISLQQATTTALAAGWYPDKTLRDPEHTCWVHCRVECGRRRRHSDVVFADFAGDAFTEELEHPGSYPAVRAVLGKCSAVIVMADALRLQSGEHDDATFRSSYCR